MNILLETVNKQCNNLSADIVKKIGNHEVGRQVNIKKYGCIIQYNSYKDIIFLYLYVIWYWENFLID